LRVGEHVFILAGVTIRSPEPAASLAVGAPAVGAVPGTAVVVAGRRQPRPLLAIAVLAFCGFVVSVTHTVVVPLLPRIPELLDTSVTAASWVLTITLLAGAIANPVIGRLGDMYGKRRMLLVSLTLLVAGSAVAALAPSLPLLLVGRALQGLSIGAIPLGISILRDELPADKMGAGIALVSATLGLGGGVGLPMSGLLADSVGWQALFWIVAVAGLAGAVLVAVLVPESPVRAPAPFDFIGAAALSITLLGLLLFTSKGADWGWGQPLTIVTLTVALVVGYWWVRWERQRAHPVVDLATTLRRPVLLTNIAGVLVGFAMFAQFIATIDLVTLPASTGHGFGESILVAGLVQLPGALMMMATSPLSSRLSAARGPRATLVVGSLLITAGYVFRMVAHGELWQLSLAGVVVFSGIGLAYGALPALIMANVPVSETAAANAVNALARLVGASVGSAATSAVLVSVSFTVAGNTYPSAAAFFILYVVGTAAALIAAAVARTIPVPEAP
jgi:MFS family permease